MNKEELMNIQPQVELFGFDDKINVRTLALSQLEQSIRVEGKNGRILQNRPIQSWNAILFLTNLLSTANVNYDLESIYVQKRNSFPMLNDEEKALGYDRGKCPINRWMFDKLVAAIQIPNVGNKLVNARIGFGFNEEGIEVAFGMNVSVCSNFAIIGGQLIHTYKWNGREGTPWNSMEYILKEWVSTLDQKMKVEMQLMERMQNTEIKNPAIINTVIGDLYKRAIDQAYVSKYPAPFDTAGMSNFVQNVLKTPPPEGDVQDHVFNQQHGIRNVWDLYNYGTSVMKPGTVDIADISTSSLLFSEYLMESFGISLN